jgi:hypothetical protein
MNHRLSQNLLQQQLITEAEYRNVEEHRTMFSLFWELRSLLYLGIVLFTTAIGVLVYKHIDTVGHDVLVICIAAGGATCFAYCLKNAPGYSREKLNFQGFWYDYILLLGCLLLLVFVGYIQAQYNVFGHRWGLAAFIPMLLLFIAAYYFDHLGVLSLAITNLAAWVGITATPTRILQQNDFNSEPTIYSAIALGVTLIAIGFFSTIKKVKAHFSFTYQNFGVHILFIALLAALFHFDSMFLLWFGVLAVVGFLSFRNGVHMKSFYFLVISALYFWIGISYVVVKLLTGSGADIGSFYAVVLYFILSGVGFIRLLIHYNKILRRHADL